MDLQRPVQSCAAADRALRVLAQQGEKFLQRFDDWTPTKADELVAEQKQASPLRGPAVGDSRDDSAPNVTAAHSPREPVKPVELDFDRASPDSRKSVSEKRVWSSRKARRLFLSGKSLEADLVPDRARRKQKDHNPQLQLHEIQREVGALGAIGLDKRQQKKAAEDRLRQLNFKPEKGQRTPANIGKRKVANRVKREQKALELGIETGMVQVKGKGKKKNRQKESEHRKRKGLNEDGGAFRNGKLDLSLLARIQKKPRAR